MLAQPGSGVQRKEKQRVDPKGGHLLEVQKWAREEIRLLVSGFGQTLTDVGEVSPASTM